MSEAGLRENLERMMSVDAMLIKRRVEHLIAVQEWAIQSLGLDYVPGDRVEICSPVNVGQRRSGWYHWREALAVGQQGIAGEIEYNEYHKRWQCLVGMDRAWSISDDGLGKPFKRYWNGPAAELPEGFELGRESVQHFMLGVHDLRKVTA